MIRFLVLILLVGAFAGGYWVGRLPNAPDIVSWAQDAYDQASSRAGGNPPVPATAAANESCSREAIVEIAGKLYKVGQAPAGSGR